MARKKKTTKKVKKDEAKADMNVTVGERDEAKTDMSVVIEAKKPTLKWSALKKDLKTAVDSAENTGAVIEMKEGTITIKAPTISTAKEASAIIWRALGNMRRSKKIKTFPKVNMVVG